MGVDCTAEGAKHGTEWMRQEGMQEQLHIQNSNKTRRLQGFISCYKGWRQGLERALPQRSAIHPSIAHHESIRRCQKLPNFPQAQEPQNCQSMVNVVRCAKPRNSCAHWLAALQRSEDGDWLDAAWL